MAEVDDNASYGIGQSAGDDFRRDGTISVAESDTLSLNDGTGGVFGKLAPGRGRRASQGCPQVMLASLQDTLYRNLAVPFASPDGRLVWDAVSGARRDTGRMLACRE